MSKSNSTGGTKNGAERSCSASDTTDTHRDLTPLLFVPFWNRTESRPRAFWRVVGAFALVAIGSQLLPLVILGGVDFPPSVLGLGQNTIALVTALLVAVVWARYVDRRRFADYGFEFTPEWARDAGVGVAVALIAWGLALAVHLSAGWAHISAVISPGVARHSLPFPLAVTAFFVQFLFVGIWEELLFRGLLLRNAAEGLETRWLSGWTAVLGGLVASSLLFGVVHADQATSLAALGFWVLMGMVLGSAYVVTDSLALPIGLHFATDFAFNNVYGLSNVRPATAEVVATVLRPEFTGPERFVEVSGLINIGAVVTITVLAAGYVAAQYGRITLRTTSVYTTT